MAAAGEPVRAYKPVLTGLDERRPGGGEWPRDHELLAAAAHISPEEVAPIRYGPAASPHLAAELAGRRVDPAALVAGARRAGAEGTLIVEGVGGLLVPFSEDYCVCDLAVELELPLLIAARPGLGTINHTLLTLECARGAGLDVRAVVLTPWPQSPGVVESSNRATIAALGDVSVETLPPVARAESDLLAKAAESLPLEQWLGRWRASDRAEE